jgi:hypothetical protein
MCWLITLEIHFFYLERQFKDTNEIVKQDSAAVPPYSYSWHLVNSRSLIHDQDQWAHCTHTPSLPDLIGIGSTQSI